MSTDPQFMHVAAWLLGSRIDLKAFLPAEGHATDAPIRFANGGLGFVFRFGAVVLIDVAPADAEHFLQRLRPHVQEPRDEPGHDAADIRVEAGAADHVAASGRIVLHEAGVDRLQVVAHVLAKSAVLAYYEIAVAHVFDRVERLSTDLRRGRMPNRQRELLREIGQVLHIQAQTVGRVEVADKPEFVWDRPDLDRLYDRLALEYELKERDVGLTRKLDLINTTAQTYLDVLHSRQGLRLEWYIVVLFVVDIVLILYEMFLS